MNHFSKRLSNFSSLMALLCLTIFSAFIFSTAVKAKSVAESWFDESDLIMTEMAIVHRR